MIQVGRQLTTEVNGRVARVVVLAFRRVAEHQCGDKWRQWYEWKVRTLDTGETIIRRTEELKPLKQLEAV